MSGSTYIQILAADLPANGSGVFLKLRSRIGKGNTDGFNDNFSGIKVQQGAFMEVQKIASLAT
jgi:hypothetical protein